LCPALGQREVIGAAAELPASSRFFGQVEKITTISEKITPSVDQLLILYYLDVFFCSFLLVLLTSKQCVVTQINKKESCSMTL
jgi:hypothetical protein